MTGIAIFPPELTVLTVVNIFSRISTFSDIPPIHYTLRDDTKMDEFSEKFQTNLDPPLFEKIIRFGIISFFLVLKEIFFSRQIEFLTFL